jgi:hypothetical protein
MKKLFLSFYVCVPLTMRAFDLFTGKISAALASRDDPRRMPDAATVDIV